MSLSPPPATLGGALLVIAVVLPLFGFLPFFFLGARIAERIALVLLALSVAVAAAIAAEVGSSGQAVAYFIGGFAPPLGVALRADGLAAVLMVMTALAMLATGLFAATGIGAARPRMPPVFWPLMLSALCALNLAFAAEDLFTLFVALELLTFAAVPLTCLDGKAEQYAAALRYLLYALFGSALYLLGVVLVYGLYGTLDIILIAGRAAGEAPFGLVAALALMSVGLMAKAALFPFYLWLPPAHAGAPAAASAMLSAVVIKAPIFLVWRLWLDLAPAGLAAGATPVIAACGAGAILLCGVFALAQPRLKLLIAYSTAAQIGYLMLVLPLAADAAVGSLALTAGTLHLVAHAFSKAAMFMAAGLIYEALGHDRMDSLRGLGRALPVSVLAFGIGGLSLMGLPPSGGFNAKVMLLTAAVSAQAWVILAVVVAGGLLAAGYVLKVLVPALQAADAPLALHPVARWREAVALALALLALALGFLPLEPSDYLAIGRPGAWPGGVP